jgi:hypothetical protein
MSQNIKITLTKEEWSDVNTWVTSASRQTYERVSQKWFTELLDIVKPFYMSLYFSDDRSAMKIPYDSEHTLEMDRKYFRYLVFSVGRIAYDFDCKTITSNIALSIVKKLEEQGDDKWKKDRW